MKMKKFRANTVREALEMVKDELGPQAVILKTENLKKGLLAKDSEVEVTAALDEKSFVHPGESKESASTSQVYSPQTFAKNRQAVAPLDTSENNSGLLAAIKEELDSIRDVVVHPSKEIAELRKEIQSLKKDVLNRSTDILRSVPDDFQLIYNELFEKDLSVDFINDIIADLTIQSAPEERSEKFIRHKCKQIIAEKLPIAGPVAMRENRASIVMFVGPTGVGKTTSIAKLAGQLILQCEKDVGIISTDCYRIGAIEQMSMFAGASNVDFEAVFELSDIDTALDNFKNKNVILIDSAGRSQNSADHISELKELIKIAGPDEIHLVLAANVKVGDMQAIFESFKPLGISRIIFTKLDETSSHASLANILLKNALPVSYLAFGQKIPDDLMIAEAESFADILLEGL